MDSASPPEEAVPRRRGRPRKTSTGSNVIAPLKLLDGAEELFAERGFYGVTTRQVAAAAGCDDALIYYHFGSKKDLFEAVLQRRAPTLNEVRRVSLSAYVAAHEGAMTVRGAIAAFVNPMIDLSEGPDAGWKSYFTIVAQIDNTPWGGDIIHRYFDPIVYELISVLKRVLTGVPDREIYWAYNFLAGSMMLALSENQRVDKLSYGLCASKDLAAVRDRLIDYCAGGFERMIEARSEPKP